MIGNGDWSWVNFDDILYWLSLYVDYVFKWSWVDIDYVIEGCWLYFDFVVILDSCWYYLNLIIYWGWVNIDGAVHRCFSQVYIVVIGSWLDIYCIIYLRIVLNYSFRNVDVSWLIRNSEELL